MKSLVLLLPISVCLLIAPAQAAEKIIPRVTVQTDRAVAKTSSGLYGVNLDEMSHAVDGGIFGELVRNQSFSDLNQWRLTMTGSAKGEVSSDDRNPRRGGSPSVMLHVEETNDGKVGLANEGYWGIPIRKDGVYVLSVTAKGAGELTACLESKDGKVLYTSQTVSQQLSGDWKTYRINLVPTVTDSEAKLVLYVDKPGTIWFDTVSLFPEKTWKDRPKGLREDLAKRLQNLHPSFVRFTFAEPNLFQTANGFGLHDYLQLCEDVGADAWLVVDGSSFSSKEKIRFVQDIQNTVEYALGTEQSPEGMKRSKTGHSRPFNLKYLEIGGDFEGTKYAECYAAVHDALHEGYPQIKLVSKEWLGKTAPCPAEIVNERYYSDPDFFLQNAHQYDSYDRKGPQISVGEYAVTDKAGQGNLRAAVAEAAFLTGIERNSEVVSMASYSPLLANVNDKQWNPNLINFDGTRSYVTPSYHVQKMFSENRSDYVVPANVDFIPEKKPQLRHGAIGLATWQTKAEFKDISVTSGGTKLFESNSLTGWKTISGTWTAGDGVLRQTSVENECRIVAGDDKWTNYTLSLKAKKLEGKEGFLIMFHVSGEKDWVWWNVGGWGNAHHCVELTANGARSGLCTWMDGKIENERWYDIEIKINGGKISCYLDGKLFQTAFYPGVETFAAVKTPNKDGLEEVVFKKPYNVSYSELDADKMPKHGGIGVGSWHSQAEFKDIRVTQGEKVLYSSDSVKELSDWKNFGGDWNVTNGVLRQIDLGAGCRVTTGDPVWSDYTLSLKARKLNGLEGFLIMFRVADDKNFIWWNVGGWENRQHGLEMTLEGMRMGLGKAAPGGIANGRWYDVRVEVRGPKIRCFLDDELIHVVNYPLAESIFASAGLNQAKDEMILKVVNTSDSEQETEIGLDGVERVVSQAKTVVLTSKRLEDENSFDDPQKVSPVESEVPIQTPSFRRTFPANSVTVMRFKVQTE